MLVASMVVRNELGRYLRESIGALEEFCDLIVCLDDDSSDGSREWLEEQAKVLTFSRGGEVRDGGTFDNESGVRQLLLAHTWRVMDGLTDTDMFILAIDADEFVADPDALLAALAGADRYTRSWFLCMQEVWKASDAGLSIRLDGGWMEHDSAMLYRCPLVVGTPEWRFPERALACGRVPPAVNQTKAAHSGSAVLHFGWAREQERAARYERYRVADGGKFHASSHLDSIMWPDDRVELIERGWPAALDPVKAAILTHAGVTA